jgi:hypothetical protein
LIEECPECKKMCPNGCGLELHISQIDGHKLNLCSHEVVLCDICKEVSLPRHQLAHHKNESCIAIHQCPRCFENYRQIDGPHQPEDCIQILAGKVKRL